MPLVIVAVVVAYVSSSLDDPGGGCPEARPAQPKEPVPAARRLDGAVLSR